MKKLSTYLFLLFFTLQAPSWADDIRDFQIEGMSIGDSLLDYFSEEEIKENYVPDVYDDKYYLVYRNTIIISCPRFQIGRNRKTTIHHLLCIKGNSSLSY